MPVCLAWLPYIAPLHEIDNIPITHRRIDKVVFSDSSG